MKSRKINNQKDANVHRTRLLSGKLYNFHILLNNSIKYFIIEKL